MYIHIQVGGGTYHIAGKPQKLLPRKLLTTHVHIYAHIDPRKLKCENFKILHPRKLLPPLYGTYLHLGHCHTHIHIYTHPVV